MWKSAVQLEADLKSFPHLDKLQQLHILSTFWRDAVYPNSYMASEEWENLLVLNDQGEATLKELRGSLTGLPDADILLAFFAVFGHHDVFLDIEKTDPEPIRQLFARELLNDRVRLPFRFGRTLYDRFNDTNSDTRTDHLLEPDVDSLLRGTPIGVYQLGALISGPMGLLDSQDTRWIPPSRTLPLWHCSDTGCNALHQVRLFPASVPVVEAFGRITRGLTDRFGPPSEWEETLPWVHRRSLARPYVDLPILIADCVIGSQRTTLVEAALLSDDGPLLRKAIGQPPRRKSASEGSAAYVSAHLTPEEQLQLMLVLRDQTIVDLIDDAVHTKRIKIPIGETRTAYSKPPRLSQDSLSDLSAFGLRSVKFEPLVNLTSAIKRAYEGLGLLNELEWRVRGDAGRSCHEALVSFVRTRGPADAARELVLSSVQITKAVCQHLNLRVAHIGAANSGAVNLLLWKLGLNPMHFDDSLPRFRARLSEFNEAILINSPADTEDARERIRAAGVNVFVSVEDFLDRVIAYNVWLLSSDHFLGSRFQYSSNQARESVERTIGKTLNTGGAEISWHSNGENALGTLLSYLSAAAKWADSLCKRDRDELQRREADLPHFAAIEHLPFPFWHTALWADADPSELRKYLDGFTRLTKLVEESELAGVRNGLDHFREAERFPSNDKLLACVARLREALDLADLHRYFPKIFWLAGRKANRFGSVEYEFQDYSGRAVVSFGPPLVSGLPRIVYGGAYLLAPASLLGTPNSSLTFMFREKTEYSSYWENYPRRRHIAVVEGNGHGEERRAGAQPHQT